MLKQIQSVRGIGLFLDAGPSPDLERVALFYGENGRGKSTLASILRSCAENRTDSLQSRKTLDAAVSQFVQLSLIVDKSISAEAIYDSGSNRDWIQSVPDLRVFDAEFVSRNVYSGAEISTDQRASLLEFALGEGAVDLRAKLDAATRQVQDITGRITTQTQVVKVHAGALSVEAFLKLPEAQNADADIEGLNKRLVAAQSREPHMRRPLPGLLPVPGFDAHALFDILDKSLKNIEANAEEAVAAHLKKCAHPDFEGWLSEGQAFDSDANCPYCGTKVEGNALIKAYQTYFNADYSNLKQDVSKLERGLQRRIGDEVVDAINRTVAVSQAQSQAWVDHAKLVPVSFDAAAMKGKLADLRALLEPLLKAKTSRPLEQVGSPEQLAKAQKLWNEAISFVAIVNQNIQACVDAIEVFKKGLAADDPAKLTQAIGELKLRKQRYSEAVIGDVGALAGLVAEKAKLAKQKEDVRKQLDALMTATLATYQDEINTLLAAFGSQARIDALKFDYRGSGVPRSDYRLRVRGQEVRLAGDNGAAFGNTLSEGDKRALAFAFFVAQLHRDPMLANRLVVIDDPMCSLDRRRRSETIRILKALAVQCRQLVVLAHDAYFLRDLDDAVAKVRLSRSYCKVVTVASDYSSFDKLDLARECASQYERDLDTVVGFTNGEAGHDSHFAATRLRVLLEGNLQRQFPHALDRSLMLGQAIDAIAKSTPPSALVALHGSVKELRAINDYAKQFHHAEDGAPPDFSPLDEGELRGYCKRTLAFILRGSS
ncbi:MAG: hypothetical protein CL858_24705 [Cupriavidus sp.]|nr:hypothetical protein [Cupriavidus sp.]